MHNADSPLPSSSLFAQKPQVPLPPSPEIEAISNAISTTTTASGLRGLDWLNNNTNTSTLSSPMRRVASSANIVNMGVSRNEIAIGPGVNPNISTTTTADGHDLVTTVINPPIVNTGNNGPMCVQPGDWICSGCGFVNWRRRKFCMRCFPHFESNEHSQAIANGAKLAAQLAASDTSIGSIPSSSASTLSLTTQHLPPLRLTNLASNTDAMSTASRTPRPISSLPARPDLGTRSVSLHRSAVTSQWTDSKDDIQNASDQQLIRALKALNISQSGSISMTSSPTTSSTLLPPSSVYSSLQNPGRDVLNRSPSVPILSTSQGASTPSSGRNIWQYGAPQQGRIASNITSSSSGSDATIVPLTSSAITPPSLTPTYRAYNPTTIFGQQSVNTSESSSTRSTTPTNHHHSPYNTDIWRVNKGTFSSSLSQLSGQSSSSKNSAASSINGDLTMNNKIESCLAQLEEPV